MWTSAVLTPYLALLLYSGIQLSDDIKALTVRIVSPISPPNGRDSSMHLIFILSLRFCTSREKL